MHEQPWAALVVPPDLDGQYLEEFCEFLTRLNERFLRAHPETPFLYKSGAFYRLQPEYWLSVPWAIHAVRMGVGLDCKSLSAWRVAELRVRFNEPRARCVWTAYPTTDKVVYHVWVQRGDGSFEDPSANLGMHQALASGGAQPRELAAWNP